MRNSDDKPFASIFAPPQHSVGKKKHRIYGKKRHENLRFDILNAYFLFYHRTVICITYVSLSLHTYKLEILSYTIKLLCKLDIN